MKKVLLFVAIVFSLQGCVAAVVIAGAATAAVAGGAIIADNRSTKTIMEDRDLTYKIQEKLANDPELQGKVHIEVASFNGVVLLDGQAPTAELRDRAVSLANSVAKIKLLHNEITLEYATGSSVRTHDSWITTKVKSSLVAEQGLSSAQMKIVTENGTVYLMGLVTKGQGDLAAKKASQVESVKKVVKLFEYIQ